MLGVRLPPDTEIIKYTSSIVGPKNPGTTNRGRKKTISLDPNPLLATLQGLSNLQQMGVSPAKRQCLEAEYQAVQNAVAQQQLQQAQQQQAQQQQQQQSQSQQNSDRVEVIKLPPTITSNGAYNLSKSAAKDSTADSNEWAGLNFSSKVSNASSNDEGDAPLNLCMKSSSDSSSKAADFSSNSNPGNSLQSLSSITAALGSGAGNDRLRE